MITDVAVAPYFFRTLISVFTYWSPSKEIDSNYVHQQMYQIRALKIIQKRYSSSAPYHRKSHKKVGNKY